MDKEINLLDLDFYDFTVEEKREVFMILDLVMKKYHDSGYMITSFAPKDIYYQNGLFGYSKYARISPLNTNDKAGIIPIMGSLSFLICI